MGKKSVPNDYARFCDSRNAYPQREIPYTEAAIDDYLKFTLKRACDEKTCEAQRKSIILEAKSIKDRMLEKLFPKGERIYGVAFRVESQQNSHRYEADILPRSVSGSVRLAEIEAKRPTRGDITSKRELYDFLKGRVFPELSGGLNFFTPKGARDISEEKLSFDDGFPVRILYLDIAKELNKAGRGDLFGLELLMR